AEAVGFLRVGEQLGIAIVAKAVEGLGVVVVRVFVVAEAVAAQDRHLRLAELEPLLDERGVVITGGEAAGDGRRRQRRGAAAAATLRQAVHDAAVAAGRVVEVLLRHLDGLGRDLDAGVAGSAKRLYLRDGHRALVEAAAIARRDIAPAAAVGLCV